MYSSRWIGVRGISARYEWNDDNDCNRLKRMNPFGSNVIVPTHSDMVFTWILKVAATATVWHSVAARFSTDTHAFGERSRFTCLSPADVGVID